MLETMNMLAVLVEFLGTFIFLSVIVATGNPWAIGATLAVLAFLGGAISGGHFNPAVTLMTLYNRGIAADSAAVYIVAQVAAGLLAVTVYNRLKKAGVL
jgi:glycerol uptake facilitator-like aquaporin